MGPGRRGLRRRCPDGGGWRSVPVTWGLQNGGRPCGLSPWGPWCPQFWALGVGGLNDLSGGAQEAWDAGHLGQSGAPGKRYRLLRIRVASILGSEWGHIPLVRMARAASVSPLLEPTRCVKRSALRSVCACVPVPVVSCKGVKNGCKPKDDLKILFGDCDGLPGCKEALDGDLGT